MPAPEAALDGGTAPAAPRLVGARALSHAAFAPFGDLLVPALQQGRAINAGTAQRFDELTRLDLDEAGGAACLAIFRTLAGAHPPPLRLRCFERHQLGSQTFVPMGDSRCLAVVAGAGPAPDETAIEAFIIEPGQGVTLRRGVWHHPLITLGAADVLVIERRASSVDCEVVPLAAHVVVTLP